MSRYRVETSPLPPGRHTVENTLPPLRLDEPVAQTVNAKFRSMNDEVIPSFHKRRAAGEIFNNPFSQVVSEFRIAGSYTNIATCTEIGVNNGKVNSARWQGCSIDRVFGAHALADPILNLGTAHAQAQQECLSRVNATQFDLGTFVGEWSKTRILHRQVGDALIKLFTSPVNKVRRGTVTKHAVYNGKGRPVLNRKGQPVYRYSKTETTVTGETSSQKTKDLANAYLVGRYGISPLLMDLENALKFLGKNFSTPRKTARSMFILTGTSNSVNTVSDTPGVWHVQNSKVKTLQVRYGLLYETAAFAAGVSALGLGRPLSTVWELVPYSFVIDWFFRVGLWLDAIQPAFSSKTLCAWVSTRETLSYTREVVGFVKSSTPNWNHNASCDMKQSMVTTTSSRGIWNANVPHVLTFGSGFSNLRCADFASLVMQRIHTKF